MIGTYTAACTDIEGRSACQGHLSSHTVWQPVACSTPSLSHIDQVPTRRIAGNRTSIGSLSHSGRDAIGFALRDAIDCTTPGPAPPESGSSGGESEGRTVQNRDGAGQARGLNIRRVAKLVQCLWDFGSQGSPASDPSIVLTYHDLNTQQRFHVAACRRAGHGDCQPETRSWALSTCPNLPV
jgi:hypothetical protein